MKRESPPKHYKGPEKARGIFYSSLWSQTKLEYSQMIQYRMLGEWAKHPFLRQHPAPLEDITTRRRWKQPFGTSSKRIPSRLKLFWRPSVTLKPFLGTTSPPYEPCKGPR